MEEESKASALSIASLQRENVGQKEKIKDLEERLEDYGKVVVGLQDGQEQYRGFKDKAIKVSVIVSYLALCSSHHRNSIRHSWNLFGGGRSWTTCKLTSPRSLESSPLLILSSDKGSCANSWVAIRSPPNARSCLPEPW